MTSERVTLGSFIFRLFCRHSAPQPTWSFFRWLCLRRVHWTRPHIVGVHTKRIVLDSIDDVGLFFFSLKKISGKKFGR
jgi:hypothetical protein